MEKITCFHLNTCPYCVNAKKAIEELISENSEYSKITVDWIEENEHPEIIEKYDYHAVPCMFVGDKKMYEAYLFETFDHCKQSIKTVFDYVLKGE
ncbi:MAG: thioredoxin family protein [Erysipelotrichaceae bacterium]|nr:thioredoxin family protein [Erysipelotrichaceae bacterium]